MTGRCLPVDKSAVLSDERPPLYRYQLDRIWDRDKPRMVWIMLNPSTADALVDDPTILACMDIACRNRCGGIRVVNLFAFRSSDPSDLRHAANPIGPDNDRWIGNALHPIDGREALVVAAWGRGGTWLGRDMYVDELAKSRGVQLHCTGRTQNGHPKHPLARGRHWVPRETPLAIYSND